MVRGYQVREVFGALEAGGTLRRPHLLCGALRNDVPLRKVHGIRGEEVASQLCGKGGNKLKSTHSILTQAF